MYIECEDTSIILGGVHFKEIKEMVKMVGNEEKVQKFWNELFGEQIESIKWCRYKNDENKYVKINDKEFVVDSDWYVTCEEKESDSDSEGEDGEGEDEV